ncbi:MAG: (d)CMP kinase [Bacilli bacterium]
MSWQIAIDGPAGAGKSTIAKMLAEAIGFEYIDTGAMYRAVTLKAMDLKINMYEEEEYKFLNETKFDFINQDLYLDGVNVSNKIRTLEISNNVSLVASIGYVRNKLVALQRELAGIKNVVMDGRDIGSVVLPNADLKIYLTATLEERARRRMYERLDKGLEHQSLEETIKEIEERDYKDSNRPINPLAVPKDAIIIDSSEIDAKKVVDKIIKLVLQRGYKMENKKKTTKEVAKTPNQEILNQGVEVLKLTPTVTKLLTEAEVTKVSDLVSKTDNELLQLPGIAAKRLETIKEKLAELGLSLAGEVVVENKKSEKKVKEEPTMEKVEVVETKEETKVEEVKTEEVVEETKVEEADEEDEVDVDDEDDDTEEDSDESTQEGKTKYRTLQVVAGRVVEVIEAKEAFSKGNKQFKAKPERVLIELEDGQQGFLFRKDTADIREDEELFDLFFEGDNVQVVIKKIYPDGGKFIFSTILLKMRDELKRYSEVIENHGTITAKVVKKLSTGYLLKDGEFSCLLPESQILKSEKDEDLIGKEIEVSPIRIDYGRIRLIVSQTVAHSIKVREEKKSFLETVNVGDVFDGTVKNIESYGAFVEIGNGVEGLLHISELDHYRVFKVEKVVKPGDTVKVKVIKIENDHIGLSRKALIPNYWVEFTSQHNVGSVVEVKVNEINNAGIVVELAENVTGFLPRSEFSYERDVNINDFLNVGDTLEAKIIEIDVHKKRIILSKKQLTENPWETVSLKTGEFIEVEVTKELKDGFKVQYGEISGYLPKASINQDKTVNVGEAIKVRVRSFDANSTRFIVQLRHEQERFQEREVYGKFTKQPQDKLTSSFGDILQAHKKKK